MVREREEAGGVSVQFTNTTVNSEAGQETERAGGRVRKRLPVQECHQNKSIQQKKGFAVYSHDVHAHTRTLLNSSLQCLLPGAPGEGCEPYRGLISNYQCYEKAPIRFRGFRKKPLTDVLLAGYGLEMS